MPTKQICLSGALTKLATHGGRSACTLQYMSREEIRLVVTNPMYYYIFSLLLAIVVVSITIRKSSFLLERKGVSSVDSNHDTHAKRPRLIANKKHILQLVLFISVTINLMISIYMVLAIDGISSYRALIIFTVLMLILYFKMRHETLARHIKANKTNHRHN